MLNCLRCHKPFSPAPTARKDARFCSKTCRVAWHRSQPVEVECPRCHQTRVVRRDTARTSQTCSACSSDVRSGARSATWRGGHRHWIPGRFGRDKDGLSWKTQRRLAWERDDYKCTRCGTKPHRKPDVHHKVPFRLSQSHALDNLKCMCQKCHMEVEATVQEVWGGAVCPPPPSPPTPVCARCPRVLRVAKNVREIDGVPVCYTCWRKNRVALAVQMKAAGGTEHDIAKTLGVSKGSAHYYANGRCSDKRPTHAGMLELVDIRE